MKRLINIISIWLLAFLLGPEPSMAASKTVRFELAASTIEISTFYNGTTVEVTGSLPTDADLLLTLSGPKHDVELKLKGKMAGLLWMNKADVKLENVPSVYQIYTPEGTSSEFPGPQSGIGYKSLAREITIEPESADKMFIFGEYVKLMEKSGVYGINRGSVSYAPAGEKRKNFSATLKIPPKMGADTYRVEAFAVKDGAVAASAAKDLTLVLSGLPRAIASLAFGRPLLFGIMAVFIAVATGLIIGALFKGGGGAH